MAFETELKLAIAAQDVPALLAHPLLAAEPSQRQRLVSTYFDTPKRTLLARRVAVRERRVGRQTLLTVKTAGSVIGGLARRGEWEAQTTPGAFDFVALVDDTTLADELQALAGMLVPVFTTDFTRRQWLVTHRKAQIEVALDRGHIHAATRDGPRSLPLLELELELKQGPPDALFSLARQLGHNAHLRPVAASKSDRGYVLHQGRRAKAVKAEALALPSTVDPVEAFRRVALACLAQLQANEAGVLHSDDIEYLHQARVALRRLRAALRVFAPALPRKFVSRWGAAWKALALSLGDARDHDVFRTSLLPGLIPLLGPRDAARLQTWARAQGDAARDAARHSLASRDTSEHLLAFTRALLRLKVDDGASASRLARTLGAQAPAPAASQPAAAHPHRRPVRCRRAPPGAHRSQETALRAGLPRQPVAARAPERADRGAGPGAGPAGPDERPRQRPAPAGHRPQSRCRPAADGAGRAAGRVRRAPAPGAEGTDAGTGALEISTG
jgi:inorganic triphosphatase YgiF